MQGRESTSHLALSTPRPDLRARGRVSRRFSSKAPILREGRHSITATESGLVSGYPPIRFSGHGFLDRAKAAARGLADEGAEGHLPKGQYCLAPIGRPDALSLLPLRIDARHCSALFLGDHGDRPAAPSHRFLDRSGTCQP